MTNRSTLADQFITRCGWQDAQRALVAGDASNRRYDRLTQPDGRTAILMDAPPEKGEDTRPFIRIANHLRAQGLSAPEIYHQDTDNGFLLIEDLHDALFARLMAQDPTRQIALYRAATDVLVHLHAAPVISLPVCDAQWLSTMIDPVFEWYAAPIDPDAQRRIQDAFYPLAASLDDAPKVTILRDYHAENLLLLPERNGVAQVGLLDFQDALLGHPAYDLVSILQDARRDVDPQIEAQMIAHYIDQTACDPTAFRTAYAVLGTQRNLRILGIFARLCLRDGKPNYVDLIPRVWDYVMRNLTDPALADLAPLITDLLPAPTPAFLEHLKSRCAATL